ncbi:LysR family transcriptional regulator [Paratractidigestivibacter sp.]|uniref:LysR family transcriptional regulator n=1 Tax=Paratractidigestivibacter sp. TaxID=2847316 RepID=UPI002ABE896F|nr:LysR family transcriptional regulator [Paratractidigestivibacter sp.]
MNTRQLEYFVAVAELQSFRRAAARLYVSQSAISQQVKALERELGCHLLDRDNHNVSLTSAGHAFLEDSRDILARLEDARKRAAGAGNGPEGELRIGYVKGYERTDLPDMLSEFHSRYPNVRLSFMRDNVSELYDALRDERIDLAINLFYSPDDMRLIETQVLRHYPLKAVLSVRHPLARRASISMADLAGEPLVDIKKGLESYGESTVISANLAEAGDVPVAYVSDDIETSVLAVAAGMGYALLPGYFTDGMPGGGRVVAVPIRGKEREMRICAAWLPSRKNELLDVFLDEFLRVEE